MWYMRFYENFWFGSCISGMFHNDLFVIEAHGYFLYSFLLYVLDGSGFFEYLW